MTDRDPLEHALRGFHHEPAPHVRQQSLAAFRAARRSRRTPWWRRPVPLHAAAAFALAAASLAFALGAGSGDSAARGTPPAGASPPAAPWAEDAIWAAAVSDVTG